MAFNYKEDYDSMVNKAMRKALHMDDNGDYIPDPATHDPKEVAKYSQIIKTDPIANQTTRALGKRTRGSVIKEFFKDGYKQQNSTNPIELYNQDRDLTSQQQEIDKHQKAFEDGMKKLKWDYKGNDNIRNAMNTIAMATSKDQLGPHAMDSGNNLDSPKNLKLYSDVNGTKFGGSGNVGAAPAEAEY